MADCHGTRNNIEKFPLIVLPPFSSFPKKSGKLLSLLVWWSPGGALCLEESVSVDHLERVLVHYEEAVNVHLIPIVLLDCSSNKSQIQPW
jgi:hypothetical protein